MNNSYDPPTIKMIFVGDSKVGKTSLLLSYTANQFPEGYVPNIFENYITQIKLDEKSVNVSLWDQIVLTHNSHLKSLTYLNADIFVIAFSVIDPISFENALTKWYPELNKGEFKSIPKLVIGNKIDARQSEQADHISLFKAQEEFEKLNLIYKECSALTQDGLVEIFLEAVKLGQQNPKKTLSHQVDEPNKKEEEYCCQIC